MISNEILNEDNMLEVEFDAVFPSYGTTNYEELENMPSINGVTLKGDKTTQDLNIEIPDVSNFTTPEDVGEMLDEFAISFEREMDDKLGEKANMSDIPDVSSFITKDVNNLTNYELKTNTGTNIALSVDPATFVMTLNLKNSVGEVLSTGTVDLPLETMVVNASYDNTTKEIILTLQNGNILRFSVADLVSGLAKSSEVYTKEEIDNKGYLTSEADPTVPGHVKNITQADITNWNNKSDFSGAYNDLTGKPTIPISTSELTNDSGYITEGVSTLVNYYDKTYINNAIGGINTILATLTTVQEGA